MAKKILIVLLMLAVVAGVAFALYYMFFRVPPPEVPPPEEVNAPISGLQPAQPGVPTPGVPTGPTVLPPSAASPIAAGGITQTKTVSDAPTVGATLSKNGTLSYYNKYDEKFYRTNADGSVTSLSNKVFHSVDKATFNPNGDQAILEFPDGSNIFYNFASGQQVTLPKHWESFEFSPNGSQIEAKSIGLDQSNRFLVVANPDGTGAKAVQALGENADKVQVAWSPNNQIIATATTGQSYGVDSKEVFFIGMNHENFKSMTVNGLNFQPKWAPSGQQMVYSSVSGADDWKPKLWVVDAAGDDIGKNRRSISVNTWADKCTFLNDKTLYCAVPNTMDEGAGLQPALYDQTPDTIYRIDVETGMQTKVAEPEGGRTVEKLMVTPDGKNLYFTDKNSGFVQQIKLKE